MATLGKVLQRYFHKIKLIRFNRIISETTDSIFDMWLRYKDKDNMSETSSYVGFI